MGKIKQKAIGDADKLGISFEEFVDRKIGEEIQDRDDSVYDYYG